MNVLVLVHLTPWVEAHFPCLYRILIVFDSDLFVFVVETVNRANLIWLLNLLVCLESGMAAVESRLQQS
jgi:hypothetical protein